MSQFYSLPKDSIYVFRTYLRKKLFINLRSSNAWIL